MRAVLTAGAVSDAFYDVMLHQELENFCNHCRTEVVPTWHHVCWECEAFADGRPNVPADPLQLRLGWNVSSQTDWQVIDPCTWKQALASVWDQCPPPDLETDPDTQWVTFNAVAVHAHEQAFELLTQGSCQVVTNTDNLQPHEKAQKGCGPKFACFNDTPKACVNFSVRKLRRDLGRLKEAQRPTEQGRFDAAQACCCKVWARRPWLSQVPLAEAIATLNVELLAAEKADRIKSVKDWREKTRTCTAYRHRWIKDSGVACPIQVKDEQTGRLASHPADVVEVLRQFWSRIWYRTEVSADNAFNAWSAVI